MLVILCMMIVLVSSYLFWINVRAGRMMKSVKLLHGTLPVVGYLTILSLSWKGIKGVTRWIEELLSLQEDHRTYLLGVQVFAAVEQETIKTILSSSHALAKPVYYSFFPVSEGTIFTCLSAKIWKTFRTQLNPTFNPKLFERYIQIMNDKAKICVKVFKEMEMKTFNVHHFMNRYTWDIVTATHFGVDENQQVAKRNILSEVSNVMMELVYQRLFAIWLHPNFIFNRSKLKKQFDSLTKEGLETSRNMVRKSLETYEANVKESSGDNNVWKPYSQLYKECLQTEDKSIERITRGINDLLIAGSDTSAVTISHLLYNLGAHPEYQEKVYKEVEELWTGTDWTRQQLSRMPYLDMVVNESLRHTSPYFVTRLATKDIDIGKCTIPEGTTIMCMIKNKNWGERTFPEPDRFNPDNFLPDRVNEKPKGHNLTFSFGPRDCPGKAFALFVIKCIVTEIVRNYCISTDLKPEDAGKRYCLMVEHTNGYPIRLTPRNQLQE